MNDNSFSGFSVSGMMTGCGEMETVLTQVFGNERQRTSRSVFSRQIEAPHAREESVGDISIHKQGSFYGIELRGAVGCQSADNSTADLIPFSLTTGVASPWMWDNYNRLRQLALNVPVLLLLMRHGSLLRDVAHLYWEVEGGVLQGFVGDLMAMLVVTGKVSIETEAQLGLYRTLDASYLNALTLVNTSLLPGILELDDATLGKLAANSNSVSRSTIMTDTSAAIAKAAKWALGDTSFDSSDAVQYDVFTRASKALLHMFATVAVKSEWPDLAERLQRTRLVNDAAWLDLEPKPSTGAIDVLVALGNGILTPPEHGVRRELAALELKYRPEEAVQTDPPTTPETP